jgi:hypothetical protein
MINYLNSEPSRVEDLNHESLSYDKVNLKWREPKRPNGILDFYFIAYSELEDMEVFPSHSDACQLGMYYLGKKTIIAVL